MTIRNNNWIFKIRKSRALIAVAAFCLAVVAMAWPSDSDYRRAMSAIRRGDMNSAAGYLKPLAVQGNRDAQRTLAVLYLEGKGIGQSYSEASKWFEKAARQNDPDAAYLLGTMSAAGLGGPKDDQKAASWYKTAAEFGSPPAQLLTATNYAIGKGVARDDLLAARWFYRAAQQGVVDAQIALASMHASGSGVPKDNISAYSWAVIAAANSSKPESRERAAQLLEILRKAMSPRDLITAQDIALAWKATREHSPALAPNVVNQKDGLQASLSLRGDEALIQWRFVRPLKTELSEISVESDRKPIGNVTAEPFLKPDLRTSILLLADVSGAARGPQIDSAKQILLTMASRSSPHDLVDAATYAANFRPLVPRDRSPKAISDAMQKIVPLDEPANLGKALKFAVELPSLAPSERRGIFVLTDGHIDDQLDSAGLIESAKANQTTLNFLVQSGPRPNNLTQLTALADATGGLVVRESDLPGFLEAPYWSLDSGGSAHVALPRASRPFWRKNPEIKVAFHFGSSTLELRSNAEARVAGPIDTMSIVAKEHFRGIGYGVLFAILGSLAAFSVRHRQRSVGRIESISVGDPAPCPLVGVLENIDNGNAYSIVAPVVRAGRGSNNEIMILGDPAISRLHAILKKTDGGVIEIENKSRNGTLVNDRPIETAVLVEGDLITMGGTTLRYIEGAQVREERPVMPLALAS